MAFTSVGELLDVGKDCPADATAGYALVVLAAAEFQHYCDQYPEGVDVLRCPVADAAPSTEEIKRAISAAECAAFTMKPWSVPFDVYQRCSAAAPKRPTLAPDGSIARLRAAEEERAQKRVLVTCKMGENRSLWIAGMALVLDGEQPSGKAARLYLEKLRGPRAFADRWIRDLLDRFYPESLAGMRPVPSATLKLK